MTTIAELDKKIADFEGSLNQPLPEAVLDSLRAKIAELQQERAWQGPVRACKAWSIPAAQQGAAIGVNMTTVIPSTARQPPRPRAHPRRDRGALSCWRGTAARSARSCGDWRSPTRIRRADVIFGIRGAQTGRAGARRARWLRRDTGRTPTTPGDRRAGRAARFAGNKPLRRAGHGRRAFGTPAS